MLTVLPFWSGDAQLAIKNIEFAIELDGKCDFDCILAHDNKADPTPVKAVAEKYFKSVRTFTYDRPAVEKWPVPQNNAFCNVARYVHVFKKPWFWWETDSVPLKAGWLQTLWDEYKRGKKPFGGHWNEMTRIFNGVAIYPPMVAQFSQKAATSDLLGLHPTAPQPQPPWDWYCSQEVFPRLHIMNHLMQHLWEVNGGPAKFPTQESVDQLIRPEAVIFHRTKDGSLIDRMRERRDRPELATTEKPIVEVNTVYVTLPRAVEIFIVSYWRDAQWLDYCLASIAKFAKGFSGVTVAYPNRDRSVLKHICAKYNAKGREFKEIEGKGHLHQNAIKCMAESFCPRATTHILHMDSDCLFMEQVTPEDYFVNSKPVLLKEEYERLKPVGGEATGYLWRPGTEKALGVKCQYETMRRHPAVHPRKLYESVRRHIEALHKMPFIDYVMGQSEVFPFGFSEFNVLGGYAHHFLRDEYHWIDLATESKPPNKMVQFWSGGTKPTKEQTRAFDELPQFDPIPGFEGLNQAQMVEKILA